MFIKPPNINSPDIRAFFTTKKFNEKNAPVNEALSAEFDISKNNVYMPVQKHTNRVHVLRSSPEPVVADAVITDREKILIGILVADCVPVLLYDSKKRIIGAVHAGWRGTAAQILKRTIRAMQEEFKSLPGEIYAALGPSIRQCSYEVSEDVKTGVLKATGEGSYYNKNADKYFIDLSEANKVQAVSSGILPENMWQSEECTFCNPDRFHSYRYSKGSAGRQGGFIGIW